jgi:predicted PhzF superfamily epimerase YddE/YHI9
LSAYERPGLRIVRVFCAEDGSHGNPLGVFLDGAEIPEAERQGIATELGFSETVFVDDAERGEMRIFTPTMELPLAGHPLVGTAWLMREEGREPSVLRPPAGEVQIRFDDGMTYAVARPECAPPFEFEQLGSPEEVDELRGPPAGRGMVGMWAWADERPGIVRERVFVPEAGVPEDEATGAAALILCSRLGREIEIRQGRGSVLYARPLSDGRAEVGGRVVPDPDARA